MPPSSSVIHWFLHCTPTGSRPLADPNRAPDQCRAPPTLCNPQPPARNPDQQVEGNTSGFRSLLNVVRLIAFAQSVLDRPPKPSVPLRKQRERLGFAWHRLTGMSRKERQDLSRAVTRRGNSLDWQGKSRWGLAVCRPCAKPTKSEPRPCKKCQICPCPSNQGQGNGCLPLQGWLAAAPGNGMPRLPLRENKY